MINLRYENSYRDAQLRLRMRARAFVASYVKEEKTTCRRLEYNHKNAKHREDA
jgi:hypothetical protein